MRRSLCAVMVATIALGRQAHGQADWVRDLIAAAQLPVIAQQARTEGVSNSEIGSIIEAVRRAGLPARDAAGILDTTRVLHREYGPTDNFGAFVQSQLAAGKRGTSLAAAIRAEHARLGKGRGNSAAKNGRGADQGSPGRGNASPGRGNAAAGRGADKDSPSRGRSGSRGKPPATH